MRLGVDARVLLHRPTGVARYLAEILEEYPTLTTPGELLELFVDRPCQVEANSRTASGTTGARPNLQGLLDRATVLRWPLPGGDPAWRQLRLVGHLARSRVDALFCPFYTVPLMTRIPRIVTIHDVSFLAHPEWFSHRARAAFSLVRPSARAARRVLTVSRFSADEIVSRLGIPANRIEVIPPGVSSEWREPVDGVARAGIRDWLGHAGPYLLHLGAVHARRNVDTVIAALARLAPIHRDLRLVIAGPAIGDDIDVAACSRELEVADRVIRRDWVPEERLRPLLAEAAALLYVSSYEGFGLPALEALAVGVPVIALRRASVPEVLGDAAVWVEDLDPGALATAVDRLLRDPARSSELRRMGPERAGLFSTREAARRTFEVLREVAAGR